MTMVRRLLSEGDVRHGAVGSDLNPADARCLLQAWLRALELEHLDERGLIAYMQQDDFSHSDLYRRACRLHERKLRHAVGVAVAAATGEAELPAAAEGLFEACVAAIPYAPATAFLAAEQAKLAAIPHPAREEGERPRVAILADGIGSTHGVTRTIEEIRQRGVPGFEIEVVGTDPEVDARLPSVADIDVPFYPGLSIGVPSLPAAVHTLSGIGGSGGYEAIHVCSPGPAGIAGALVARALRLPLVGSYHTELTAYAGLRSGERRVADAMALAVGTFYSACDVVLSPSRAADEALAAIGMPAERVLRWDRGVDTARFHPGPRDTRRGDTVNVMYSGRITREKGVELLADAFLLARAARAAPAPDACRRRPRAGAPARAPRRARELPRLARGRRACARRTASADIFLFPSATDTFGQVILEAQASGLPVIAVAEGGPLSLIDDGLNGRLCEALAERLADAVLELAGSPLLREHLSRGGLAGRQRAHVGAHARASRRRLQTRPARVRLAGAGPCGIADAPSRPARIAVALHDIEPATFERCALIRDWLDDHGVDRVTLLVIPARDLHPLGERCPEMVRWLNERRLAGDSIAQHGFQHQQLRRGAAGAAHHQAGARRTWRRVRGARRRGDTPRRGRRLAGAQASRRRARRVRGSRLRLHPRTAPRAATQVPLVGQLDAPAPHAPGRGRGPHAVARSSLGHGHRQRSAPCGLSVADPHREPLVRRHAAPGPTPQRSAAHSSHARARVGPRAHRAPAPGDHLPGNRVCGARPGGRSRPRPASVGD